MNSPAEIEIPAPLTAFDGISKAYQVAVFLSHSYLHSKSSANGATSRCFRSDWSITERTSFIHQKKRRLGIQLGLIIDLLQAINGRSGITRRRFCPTHFVLCQRLMFAVWTTVSRVPQTAECLGPYTPTHRTKSA